MVKRIGFPAALKQKTQLGGPPCPSTSPPNKTTLTKNSKSAWLLPEYVNACHSVAKVVCWGWQVLDAQSACYAIKLPALPTPNNC